MIMLKRSFQKWFPVLFPVMTEMIEFILAFKAEGKYCKGEHTH
jgi:hypothetical protein